ncbi:pyridoxamine 5'-phosphate oxidase family protein [Streptomyces lydicus]|uniref:pyridoxamine 5'-phosphate oxidase family protein n=1 Tax=Streptomyces lydicus TaxID=47763 RepID=UPI00340D1EA9
MAEMSGRKPSDPMAGTHGAAGTGAGSGTACPVAMRRALAAHTTLTLAYVDEDGPQACAVLYATGGTTASSSPAPDHAPDSAPGRGPDVGSGPALYFVTATTTRHGRALAEPDARVAFTVQRDGQEWGELTGIQGRGRCRILAGAERAAGWRVYTERFPFVEQSDRLRDALERTTLWELRPDWLRLIDNGQGFGHKEEWQRPEGQPLP